jgi:hypothetical protein
MTSLFLSERLMAALKAAGLNKPFVPAVCLPG